MRRSTGALLLAALLAASCAELAGVPDPPEVDPDLAQRGALIYLDARVSPDGSRSCATCHPGGGSNGVVYLDGRPVAPGTPGGRKTPRLWGLWQTPPYLWDGSEPELRPVIERMLRVEMGGAALGEVDLRALETYLLSIGPFDRRRLLEDGTPAPPNTFRQRRGRELFVQAKCGLCHPAPAYTRPWRRDLGTGGKWNVPTLRGLTAPGSAPYAHDGRWPTIDRALRSILDARGPRLEDIEVEQLLEYLKLF